MGEFNYSESNFENAVLEFFEKQGYVYECGRL